MARSEAVPQRKTGARKDPPRRLMSLPGWNSLANRDPEKDYVWAWSGERAGAEQTGVNRYVALGYEVVLYTANGVRPEGMRVVPEKLLGKEVEWQGHFLMQCDREVKVSRDFYGDNGVSGQDGANKLAKKITSPAYAREILQNIGRSPRGGRFISLENETEPAVQEQG